jgi:4-methyl-5(b-hydroxyethyl)-thiazole monophosphate biosynthesis
MAKRLLVIVYPGVAEWEVTFPLFCLGSAIAYKFASVSDKRVKGAMSFEIEAEITIGEVDPSDFDGVYLPGGVHPQKGGFNRDLCHDEGLLSLLKAFAERGKVVAALCGAPLVLGAAGLLDGRRFACEIKGAETWLDGGVRVTEPVAIDGSILTASLRGIIPFAANLARLLGEERTAQEIEEFFVAGRKLVLQGVD